jgi:hypothetical protein
MAGDETNSGWISIYRKIREHWLWQDPVKFQRWVDLLLEVNHTGRKVNLGCAIIECERGQTIRSLSNWAKRWKCSKSSARRFLELLEKDQMIVSESVSKTTRITVCNYDDYQKTRTDDEPMMNRSRNDDEPIADPNNNYNNSNNRISKDAKSKIDVYPFDEFWNDYDKKRGSKEKLIKKWNKISDSEKLKIKEHIPIYKKSQPDKAFRKDPETFLNNKSWNDEIIKSSKNGNEQITPTKTYENLFQ